MIGILGMQSSMGRQVVRLLTQWGGSPVRGGSRRMPPADLPSCVSWQTVDIADPDSLQRFVAGCELVINCAGPSHITTPRVLSAALRASAHLIDAGGASCKNLNMPQWRENIVLLDAGAVPGLSGWLPRWLAQDFSRVDSLQVWQGILDRFTPSGAEDFLAGVPIGRYQRSADPLAQQSLPFFPRPVQVMPWQDNETQWVSNSLGVGNSRWFSVSDGQALPAVMRELAFMTSSQACTALVNASAQDVQSFRPYVRYLLEVTGEQAGGNQTESALIQGEGVAQVCGTFIATLAAGVITSPDSFCRHNFHAAQVPLLPQLIRHLFSPDSGVRYQRFPVSVAQLMETEGGSL
ncbi:hypothetical protein B5864_13925 [Salmonella enterica]|uniref:Saccharopine dehydrogenase n=2 Tax=Salmonella enterica TaxID=28901 RepID=A0A403T258_SALER|nr:hypothetical protein [Salmonella sp. SG203]EAB7739560.1 hypothetical protein [Salmonella enterica subsp. enterica serovar Hadar]EAV6575164.1 hypothetical protein [Salmonella enterica]EBQ9003912.1 hypothetical protein [Salmonella enterica subsp. enterica serovar Blockley]EBR8258954.1 hypothetical protein [Salmonella enterica subsp. enterica serovar Cerro]EBW7251995.1 hypothetical protein [Salmonella enterica subsp. enterica serovar Gatow]EBX7469060.1 hypothetical protein [Salmonella enteric